MRRELFLLIIYLTVLILTGCASQPTIRQMQEESKDWTLPAVSAKDNAVVYVIRPSLWFGSLGRFTVFLDSMEDSAEKGFTKNGKYIYFTVTPGRHTVYSIGEISESISINAEPDSYVFIKQTPTMGFFRPNNKLEIISEIEGKYLVKKLKKGTIKNGKNYR